MTYVYDTFGRPSEIIQANQAKHSFSYDPAKLVLTQETVEYDFNNDGTVDFTRTLDRSHDSLLRPTGYQLKNGAAIESSAAYTFDDLNRLSTVSDGTNTFTYAYLAQAPGLVQSVTGPAHTVTNTYEPHRNILTQKTNSATSTNSVVSQFSYTSNSLGQRSALNTSGTAFSTANTINWAYNPAGEIINTDHSNNTFDQSWNYDGIGNRKTATDSSGTTTYTANPWNQYTAITGQPAGRTQDSDGNLTSGTIPADLTANSSFVWDAENRLVKITKPDGDVIDFDYDYMSRRIQKTVHQQGTDPNNESQITNNSFFVYDDWNPIGEYTITATLTSTLSKSYLWGMDLSGSMQGAGGVGGLLAVKEFPLPLGENQGENAMYFPIYDGNGNVSEYLNATGTVVAHYEYETFGNTIVKTGALADNFTHRFSTKYLDVETGLYYYGHRYYDSVTGRWPSRDPIEEFGCWNVYGYVSNAPISSVDVFGLTPYTLPDGKVVEFDNLPSDFQKAILDYEREKKELENLEKEKEDLDDFFEENPLPKDGGVRIISISDPIPVFESEYKKCIYECMVRKRAIKAGLAGIAASPYGNVFGVTHKTKAEIARNPRASKYTTPLSIIEFTKNSKRLKLGIRKQRQLRDRGRIMAKKGGGTIVKVASNGLMIYTNLSFAACLCECSEKL